MPGVHFGNCVRYNSNLDKISHSLTKKSIFRTECNYLWDKKNRIVNQILLFKLWYIGQIHAIPKFIKKEIKKKKSSALHLKV